MRWSEDTVRAVLMPSLLHKGLDFVIPNTLILGWESDLIAVARTGLISEYEIKVSMADFKADFKKEKKHATLLDRKNSKGPSYFYYACPMGVIKPGDVPEYAGLIWVTRTGMKVVVKAPCLHRRRLDTKTERKLVRLMNYRLWRDVYTPLGWTPPKSKEERKAARRRQMLASIRRRKAA